MKLLLIHPNFPGQFLHIARHFAARPGTEVVALGRQVNLKRQTVRVPGVRVVPYQPARDATAKAHHYVRGLESHVLSGQACLKACMQLKQEGFIPDTIVVHPGWGDGLFLRRIFPAAKIVAYLEFYHHPSGKDMGFDPEFPISLDNECELQIKNATNLLTLESCDVFVSPTQWQASLFPEFIRPRISVIHDGVDTQDIKPDPAASFCLPSGRTLSRKDEVLTLINRQMEPYRGFHVFMRALPEIQKARPECITLIVGSDQDVPYSNGPKGGGTWKEALLKEVGDQLDHSRLFFLGALPQAEYLKVLQISRAHVYMTYPFILSWSMLEAMSAGCVMVASRTPPVTEVINHGENGVLFDFFDKPGLIHQVTDVLASPERYEGLRQQARQTVIDHYDLATVCLPKLLTLIEP